MLRTIASIIALSILLLSSCRKVVGEGPSMTESRSTQNFTSVELAIPANVFYTKGINYKIELKAQQNILDEIETSLSNSELKIKTKRNNVKLRPDDKIEIYITAPSVNGFTVSGSGTIHSNAAITSSSLRLEISGSGDIKLNNASAASVNANIAGSGNITINNGVIPSQVLKTSGSGNIDLLNVSGKSADVTISGSGNINLFVTDQLHARIAGSGSVFYKGNPQITTEVSGSGKISHL